MDEIIRQLRTIDVMPLSSEARRELVAALQLIIDGVGYQLADGVIKSGGLRVTHGNAAPTL